MMRYLFWGAVLLAGLVVLVIVALASGIARGPVESLASRLMERPVTMESFKVYVVRRTPLLHVEGLQVANADWTAGDRHMVDLGSGKVALRWANLLKGEIRLARLELDSGQVDLLREASGRANWQMGASKPAAGASPLQLPVIERFIVRDSRIRVKDEVSKIAFEGHFQTEEGTGGGTEAVGGQPFSLGGRGQLNGQDFRLDLTGGTIQSALGNGTYPFDLDVRHGATHITAKGTLNQPTQFGDLKAKVLLEGKNLADLYDLTGIALPITRAYSLSGDLSRKGTVYEVSGLQGKLGGSDLNGDVRLEVGKERPLLWADLHSKLLDPADAGVIFGGSAESKYLLPDSKLDLTKLRSVDAEVRYTAAAINVDSLPLKEVALTMTLDNGRLALAPLAVTLPQGLVSGSIVIDGSKDVPALAADMKLTGARLEDFAAKAGQAEAISGPLVARVKLAGSGMSIHDAAGHADGSAAVVIPRGEIRKAFAELAGVSAVNGLGLLLTGDTTQTEIRCGVASFEAKDGLLAAQHLTVDSDVVRIDGGGRVNLRDESMNLTLRGKPKEARLVRLLVPVHVGGTLKSPDVGVNPVPVGVQAGVATALGVVLTPLAAVLPFVDVGLADDANCAALMAEAKGAGAPAVIPVANQ